MTLLLSAAATVVLSFLLALVGTQLAKRLAVAWNFIAYAEPDRFHRSPTPMLGGVAILLAILLPAVLALALAVGWATGGEPTWLGEAIRAHIDAAPLKAPTAVAILAGAVALHVIGLLDDRKRLGPWLKLTAQLTIAVAVVLLCNLRLLEMLGEPASSILSVAWILLIINAFNLLDHIDGLAAGVAAICAAALLPAAIASGQLPIAGCLCLLAGAAAGFLVHNFPPASIFMGDAGSLVLGYLLAVLSILTTYRPDDPQAAYYGIFAPVVLMAVPLYDTFSVLTLRLRERANLMVGDTRHFSHRLLRRGMRPRKAVLTIYLATAATAIGASLLPRIDLTGAVLVFAQTAGIVLLIALLESADRPRRGKA